MTTQELTAKVKKIKTLQQQVEDINVFINDLKAEVKAEMTARGTEEARAGPFKIRYASVISERFDSAAFKAQHADIYEMFTKTSTSMRLYIT